MNAQFALYVAAAITLIFGAVLDHPRFNVTRCIALGLALIVIAQVIR